MALTDWTSGSRGAFLEGVAFQDYVFGKPKIGHLKLIWVADANTLVANLLFGAIQYVDPTALEFEQALVLKRQWVATGEGTIAYNPTKIRYVQIQYKPEYASPQAIQDLRVRQALAHATDKQALADAMIDGEPGQADTFLSPLSPYFADLDKVLKKYPLDLRRSEQLMNEAGFTKDGTGGYAQSGVRLIPELAAFSGQGEKEALILQDSWKRAGVETTLRTITPAQQRDLELVSTYPAFRIEQTNADRAGGPPRDDWVRPSGTSVGRVKPGVLLRSGVRPPVEHVPDGPRQGRAGSRSRSGHAAAERKSGRYAALLRLFDHGFPRHPVGADVWLHQHPRLALQVSRDYLDAIFATRQGG